MDVVPCGKTEGSNILAGHCELQQWSHALTRLGLHPHEVTIKMPGGKLPLHIACSNSAPAVFVLALSSSFPAALDIADDDGMTPLHCACSCPDVALDTLEALLRWSKTKGGKEMLIQDSDGDTPLHSACRVTTSEDVLRRLVKANPAALKVRDKEGLTPLLRLWVRPSVLYGPAQLESIGSGGSMSEMSGEMSDLWKKTLFFLESMSNHNHHHVQHTPTEPFRVVHSIIQNDCPRSVLKIAMQLYPEEVDPNILGTQTLSLAISAPTFKVRELTDEGFFVSDGDNNFSGDDDDADDNTERTSHLEDPNMLRGLYGKMRIVPSVIETLLQHKSGSVHRRALIDGLPYSALHKALKVGKGWTDGINSIASTDPDSIQERDEETQMYPFMLAAVFCKTKATHVETIYQLLRLRPEFVELGTTSAYEDNNDRIGPSQPSMISNSTTISRKRNVSNTDFSHVCFFNQAKKMKGNSTNDICGNEDFIFGKMMSFGL